MTMMVTLIYVIPLAPEPDILNQKNIRIIKAAKPILDSTFYMIVFLEKVYGI